MAKKFYISVDRGELSQALNSISAYDGKARDGVEKALRGGAKRTVSDAKRRIRSKTGNLRKGVKSEFYGRGGVTPTAIVESVAYHSHLVEFGAKATTTRLDPSAGKKALKIVDTRVLRYANHADIPVRRPHPFLKPAYDAQYPQILKDVKEAVK
nr:MAG TPA: putative tail component [Bacteriophage sp.]